MISIVIMQSLATSASIENRSGATSDEQLVDLWLRTKQSTHTRRAYAADAAAYLAWCSGRYQGLRTVDVAHLQQFVDSLVGSPATRARRIASVKSLHSFAQRTGYSRFDVAAVIDVPKVPNQLAERMLSEFEVEQLLTEATGRTRALIRFLYASGARISEACDLRWQHVHASPDGSSTITLHGKGAKTRFVRISSSTTQTLLAMRGEASDDAFVFASRTGGRLDPVNATQQIRAAGWLALKRNVGAHHLRHAHASHALDRGAPVHLLQSTLGHASLATTSRYVHAKPGQSSGDFLSV